MGYLTFLLVLQLVTLLQLGLPRVTSLDLRQTVPTIQAATTPVCDRSILQLPVEYDAQGKVLLPKDGSCTLPLLSAGESKHILRGQWLVFTGGSVSHVNARRVLSFLLTDGQDLSFSPENCTADNAYSERGGFGHNRYLRNLDFIWRPDGVVLRREKETYRYGLQTDKDNLTEAIRSASAFLNEGSQLVLGEGSWMRISVVDDRYMAITPGLLHGLLHDQIVLPPVFSGAFNVIAGPIGSWFSSCFPNNDNAAWKCPNKALKRQTKLAIYQAYGDAMKSLLGSLEQLRRASVLSNAIILAHREGFFERILNVSYQSAIGAGIVNQSYSTVQGSILIKAPHMADVMSKIEYFEGHPAPITSLWEWSALLTAMDSSPSVSSVAMGDTDTMNRSFKFSNECSTAYMRDYPEKVSWDTGLSVPGCSVVHNVDFPLNGSSANGTVSADRVVWLSGCDERETSTEDWADWSSPPSSQSSNNSNTKRVPSLQRLVAFDTVQESPYWANSKKFMLACICVYIIVQHCMTRDKKQPKPPANTASTAATTASQRISGLGFARYLASIHIVLGHLQAKGLLNHLPYTDSHRWQYFCSWGFTWVPFFFLVSGFILTHSKLQKPPQPTLHEAKSNNVAAFAWRWDGGFMLQRLADIYPAYFIGLLLSFFLNVVSATPRSAVSIAVNLVLGLCLLQAWLPFTVEQGLQVQCWFLSCQVFYWVLFPTLYHEVNKVKSIHNLLLYIVLCAVVIPAVPTMLIPATLGMSSDWYAGSKTSPTMSMLVSILKFSPFSFLHIFVLGMLLAVFLRRSAEEEHNCGDKRDGDLEKELSITSTVLAPTSGADLVGSRIRTVLQYAGVSLAYVALLLVFLLPSLQPFGWRLSCRLGLLAGLHAVLLLGLAHSLDPLCKLFQLDALCKLGDISYAQYILQFLVLRLTPYQDFSSWSELGLYFLCLNAAAVCLYHAVQLPLKDVARFTPWLGTALPTTLFLLLVVLLLLRSQLSLHSPIASTSNQRFMKSPKEFVRLDAWSYDMKLHLDTDSKAPSVVINPSTLMSREGKLVVSARKHRLESRQYQLQFEEDGVVTTVLEYIYHSALVVGELDPVSLRPLGALQTVPVTRPEAPALRWQHEAVRQQQVLSSPVAQWIPCVAPSVYFPYNHTLVKVVTTGPQDPRLLQLAQHGQEVSMSFFSMIPATQPDATCVLNDAGNNNLIGRPYLGNLLLGNSTRIVATVGDSYAIAMPTNLNAVDESGKDGVEKNWLLFETISSSPSEQPHLFAVYAFYPNHVVFDVHDTSVVFEADSTSVFRKLVEDTARITVHGGANPINILWFGEEVLLSSFHTVEFHPDRNCPQDDTRCRQLHPTYRHYLYTFQPSPPFQITRISQPLLLQEHPNAPGITFVSSVMLWKQPGDTKEQLLVAYGSGDQESRVLVMAKEKVLGLFDGGASLSTAFDSK